MTTHSLDNLTRCISLDEARGREAVGKGFPAHGYRRTIHPTYREASWPNEPVAGKSFQRQDGQVCLLRREEERRGRSVAAHLHIITTPAPRPTFIPPLYTVYGGSVPCLLLLLLFSSSFETFIHSSHRLAIPFPYKGTYVTSTFARSTALLASCSFRFALMCFSGTGLRTP